MIKTYKNFLENKFLDTFLNKLNNQVNSLDNVWTSSLGWNKNIIKTSAPILMYPIKNQGDIDYIANRYRKIKYNFRDLTICFYYWPKGSYIPFHHDDHPNYAAGSTIYLNKEWHVDWGGFYLWQDKKNKYHAEVPEYNKMILNNNQTNHGTSLVSHDALQARMTLQIFFLK